MIPIKFVEEPKTIMPKLFNKQSQKKLRQKLRTQGVFSEIILWKKLSNKKIGYKFRRQQGIGNYIVDFYCPKLKLVVELDGGTHVDDSVDQYDKKRESFLESNGLVVRRYLNSEIKNNIDYVISDLIGICRKLDGGVIDCP